MATETSDRVSLNLAADRVGMNVHAICRDRDTREWFLEAKGRSEDRLGRDLTYEEFTRLLLDIFEFHEEPVGEDDSK